MQVVQVHAQVGLVRPRPKSADTTQRTTGARPALDLAGHRDSENDPLTRQFCTWLEQRLSPGGDA